MSESALRVRDARADDLSGVEDALSDIFHRRFEVLRVHNVFSEAECAAAVERLVQPATFQGAREELFYRNVQSGSPGMVILGDSISRKTPDYFAHAAAFEAGCARMFGGHEGLRRITDVMEGVAGGRPVERPRSTSGEPYGLATIRMVSPGGDLLLHCGNAFYAWPSYDALRPLLDTTMQFSFFVVLQAPEAGGALEVYDADYSDPSTPCSAEGWDAPAIEAGYPSVLLPAVPGQMILFDGGRYFHRVRTVEGSRTRFTIGGFLSLSTGHDRVLHWA